MPSQRTGPRRITFILSALCVTPVGACQGPEGMAEGLPPVSARQLARGPLEVAPAELAEGPLAHPRLRGKYVRVYAAQYRSTHTHFDLGDMYFNVWPGPDATRCFWIRVHAKAASQLPRDGCWFTGRVGIDAKDFPGGMLGYGGPFGPAQLPPKSEWEYVVDTRAVPATHTAQHEHHPEPNPTDGSDAAIVPRCGSTAEEVRLPQFDSGGYIVSIHLEPTRLFPEPRHAVYNALGKDIDGEPLTLRIVEAASRREAGTVIIGSVTPQMKTDREHSLLAQAPPPG